MIYFSHYSAYRVGKDLGRDLEVLLTVFGWLLDCFFNDLGGHIGMILLLLFILFQYSFQIMRSPCQEDCEADVSIISTCCHAFVVFNLLSCFSRFQLAVTLYILSVQFPDNAKPMSRWMRSRCQYNAKPMSRRMRSRCQDKCEADVKLNAKPMSGWMRSRCQYNAKLLSRWIRSRCQDECEADVTATAKPMSRKHSHAHAPNGSTHANKQIDAKWKHAVRYVLSMFALITSPPPISSVQCSITL